MIPLRYVKVFRDLMSNRARTLLVVLAIAVGVLAFGSVFITQDLLLTNMQREFRDSNGSNITLYLTEFDDSLVSYVSRFPGVRDAEGKASATATYMMNGAEKQLTITALPDYSLQRMNKLVPKAGSWPPGDNEIVLERSSYRAANLSIGDTLRIEVQGERVKELYLSGVVYDNSAFPYLFTQQLNGFVTWKTMAYLGYPQQYTQLLLTVTPEIKTLPDAEKLVYDLTEELDARGIHVRGSMILPPHEHWAEKNSRAFTAILSLIGVFSLVLSGFLVINTISAILTQHKKQIGILKAIGGRVRDVVAMYLLMVTIYGLLALIAAVPLSMLLGYGFFSLVADFLNLDIRYVYLPRSVFFMELGAAFAIPLAAALIPIISSSRYSIREALSDFSSSQTTGRLEQLLARMGSLPRPVLLSFRNVFRKKARLLLTLGTLVTAGAVFMGVVDVRKGMYLEIDRLLGMYDFGVLVRLDRDYDSSAVTARVADLPGVEQVETRTHMSGKRIKNDGSLGAEFGITGLEPATVFSHPEMLAGRWLISSDTDQAVIGSGYQTDNPDIAVGSDIYVDLGEKKKHIEVVGIVVTQSGEKTVFMNQKEVAAMKDRPGQASSILIKTAASDKTSQEQIAADIKERLERAGVTVAGSDTRALIESTSASQFNFMIFFLLSMAVLIAVVGGLGLAGTMSLNVMERTREIGIMRSLGAGDAAVRQLVLIEGLSVGFISFVVALPLSLPLAYLLCYSIGQAFFGRTLALAFVPAGAGIWLGIITVIAALASLVPARRASRMSISDTLSYE